MQLNNKSGSSDQLEKDPLGRLIERDGNLRGAGIVLPDEVEIMKSKEIFSELYKRSSERNRPKKERDYIDRLLDWN